MISTGSLFFVSSATSSAVISLVMLAIGSVSSGFRRQSTRPLFTSNTSAALGGSLNWSWNASGASSATASGEPGVAGAAAGGRCLLHRGARGGAAGE